MSDDAMTDDYTLHTILMSTRLRLHALHSYHALVVSTRLCLSIDDNPTYTVSLHPIHSNHVL